MEVKANQQVPYLLSPVYAPPRLDLISILSHVQNPSEELAFLFDRQEDEPLIVDLETNGTKAFRSDNKIVGIGFADSRGSLYVDLLTSSPAVLPWLIEELYKRDVPLVAHNVAFDGTFLLRESFALCDTGLWLNWICCTYALYRQVATEKFLGQQYGLKKAQGDLLGWTETNEVELDQWLIDNRYVTGKGKDVRPDKSQMWRAPCEILGKYCALDCDSTYSLYHKVLNPVQSRFPMLRQYHEKYFMRLEELLARQQLCGIEIDVPALVKYKEDLSVRVQQAIESFEKHPQVAEFIEARRQREFEELLEMEPEKYKKKKDRQEPPKYKKNGEISSAWNSWYKAENMPRELMANWKKWKNKVDSFTGDGCFNLNSDIQLRQLFYEFLEFPVLEVTEETALPAVGVDALKGFGEVGKLLENYRDLEKELQYVTGCVDYVALSDSGNVLHPIFRVPGTHTGRLSGGQGKDEKGPKVNVQQIPHSVGYLSCWRPRKGKAWIQIDWCLHPNTELLTKNRGWVKVLELTELDFVWQVNKDTLEGSWVNPSRVVRKDYSGTMYTYGNRRGTFSVTENHTMLWLGQQSSGQNKQRKITLSQEGIPTGTKEIGVSTFSSSLSNYSKEEIWMACLIQADAAKRIDNKKVYRIEVSIPRKIQKIKELTGQEPKCYIGSNRNPSYIFYSIPFSSPLLSACGKYFDLSSLGSNQAEEFLSALTFWDGSVEKGGYNSFSTCTKAVVDEIQSYFVRSGYECKWKKEERKHPHNDLYRVRITKGNSFRVRDRDITTYQYEGKVGCVTVPEGFILIRNEGQTFITGNCALESVILTALTGDPSLLSLYGPNAKPNDIHLFLGARIPGIKDKILAYGYDPFNATEEAIELTKKMAKKERGIAKTANYGLQYGAGAKTLTASLLRDGVDANMEMAKDIIDTYNELYKVSREWIRWLEAFHEQSGGWVPNAMGRPITLWIERIKDISNMVVQSSGHDCHILFCYCWSNLFNEHGVNYSGIVVDFHDESIVEVDEDQVDLACELFLKAVDQVNEFLDSPVKLSASPRRVYSMAEAKCEG